MIYTNNTVLYVITILFIPDKWLLKACYHQGDISGVTKIGKYASGERIENNGDLSMQIIFSMS